MTVRASVSRCVVCQPRGGRRPGAVRTAGSRCTSVARPRTPAPRSGHAAALEAAARARLLTYRVILTLHVDQAVDSPASWDWPSRLGLRPPEGVVVHVERLREETGETDAPVRPPS